MNFDYCDGILKGLKLLGIVVGGAAGWVSASPDKPVENKPDEKVAEPTPESRLGHVAKEVFSKKWARKWLVICIVVSLLSQFVETIKSNHDAKEARDKDREQIRLATNSLHHLERIVTRFERLSVKLTCSFPCSWFSATNTFNDLKGFAESFQNNHDRAASNIPEASYSGYYGTNHEIKEFGLVRVIDLRTNSSDTKKAWRVTFTADKLCITNWPSALRTKELKDFLTFLKEPSFILQLYALNSTPNDPDFQTSAVRVTEPPAVGMSDDLKWARVTWRLKCPAEAWDMKSRMTSAMDLSNVTATIIFPNLGRVDNYKLDPKIMALDFDKAMLMLTDFHKQFSTGGFSAEGVVETSFKY